MVDYEPVETDIEVRKGPIWTQLEVSTFTGERETSPDIKREEVDRVHKLTWDIVESMKTEGGRPYLDFAGDIQEHDIFCVKDRNIVMSCFIRHPEDTISIKILWELANNLKEYIDDNTEEHLHVRNLSVVSEEWVKQQHPEIV